MRIFKDFQTCTLEYRVVIKQWQSNKKGRLSSSISLARTIHTAPAAKSNLYEGPDPSQAMQQTNLSFSPRIEWTPSGG